MEDVTTQQQISKFWLYMLVLDIGLWAGAYLAHSAFLLIAAAMLTFKILKGDASGRAVIGGLSWLKHTAERNALEEWQGNYYSFNNQQIRIIDAREKRWVVAQDLVQAAGLKYNSELKRKLPLSYPGYRQISDSTLMGFDQEAALKFLAGKQQNNAEVIKLKLWLEREVFGELARQRQHGDGKAPSEA